MSMETTVGKITTTPQPNIGLSDAEIEGVATILSRVLANEHVLYMRLRNYHWNLVGMAFGPLHALFEAQYDAIVEDIDAIAERIRMLGPSAPGTLSEMLELTTLTEEPGVLPDAQGMVTHLVADHETIIRHLRQDVRSCDEHNDTVTSDFLVGVMERHEKMAWLLRAHIEQRG